MKFKIAEQVLELEEGGYVKVKVECLADEVAAPEVAPEAPVFASASETPANTTTPVPEVPAEVSAEPAAE